jgi:hypothetical protein
MRQPKIINELEVQRPLADLRSALAKPVVHVRLGLNKRFSPRRAGFVAVEPIDFLGKPGVCLRGAADIRPPLNRQAAKPMPVAILRTDVFSLIFPPGNGVR